MTLQQRINAFTALGNHLKELNEDTLLSLLESARAENPWFTEEYVRLSLTGITNYTDHDKLLRWTKGYNLNPTEPKTIALVMAGNIPLVGFHDLLAVLISGHRAQLKLSSKDSKLIRYIIKHLVWLEPEFGNRIVIQEGTIENFDAVIATGSNNSARYFEYYFKKYPHIIRKNRTSCAVLTGLENETQLKELGNDIFNYFGLGCRNVSKIFIPKDYDLTTLLPHWEIFNSISNHYKYFNNYEYQKSILLVNRSEFLDNGFLLLQENTKIVSPISVLYYEYYNTLSELTVRLEEDKDKIQCIAGNAAGTTVEFGKTQKPELWDYADQIDTLKFLSEL
jgi:hypothetical protein